MTGAPRRRNSFGANRVSQVTGLSSGCVPCFQTPPGAFATRPFSAAIAVAFSEYGPLGTPECHSFRGQLCTAHGPACLRFAGVVTFTVARLASGVSGLTLHRAGFAPAGQHTRFLEAIASSDPPRPAGPGRTMLTIRIRPSHFTPRTLPSHVADATYAPATDSILSSRTIVFRARSLIFVGSPPPRPPYCARLQLRAAARAAGLQSRRRHAAVQSNRARSAALSQIRARRRGRCGCRWCRRRRPPSGC